MKLTLKLALAVLPGALLVVAAAAFLEFARDRAEFEADQRADDRRVASALANSFGELWEAVGEQPATAAMDRLRDFDSRYRVHWQNLAVGSNNFPDSARAALARGEDVFWRETRPDSAAWQHAATPVRAHSVVVGAVDVSEPPPDLSEHIRRTIQATAMTTLALAITMVLVTLLVGGWVVGRPISALIAQTRRVAAGDLSARALRLPQDELGELGHEIDGMLDRLEVAAAEVKESTRKRFATLEQLRHAERLTTIGRLASSIAHEMGTPLNVVAGRARLILEDEREPRAHATIILDQAERMTKIIRQLLDYARRRPPQKEEQDLVQIVSHVLTLVATLARKRRVELQFHPEVPFASVTADPTQLQQALTNLVVNAIQASADGGVVDVTVKDLSAPPPAGRRSDGEAGVNGTFVIDIQDHGAGMSPEVLARVFEPFFTTKPVGESTGLGLSVTHDIVDEHGGWIEAQSEPGRGSHFVMFLPRRVL